MRAKAFINFYAILLTTAVDIRPNRAERAGMSSSELRETLVTTLGLDDNRSRAIAVGDATARFEVVAPGRGVTPLREDGQIWPDCQPQLFTSFNATFCAPPATWPMIVSSATRTSLTVR